MSVNRKMILYLMAMNASLMVAFMLRVVSKLNENFSTILDLGHVLLLLTIPIFIYFLQDNMKKIRNPEIAWRKLAVFGSAAVILVLVLVHYFLRDAMLSYVMGFGLSARKSETVVLFSAFIILEFANIIILSVCLVKS